MTNPKSHSTSFFHGCLSVCKKWKRDIKSFKRYKWSKIPAISLANKFWAKIWFVSKKSLHHLKCVMLFYFYAKNYKKRSNGSKDIIWRIELSDWSRAKMPISRKPDFSQTCGFRRMIENHNIFHFKPFLATSNDSILHKSPKTLILGTFGQIWAKPDFFRKIGLCYFSAFMDP